VIVGLCGLVRRSQKKKGIKQRQGKEYVEELDEPRKPKRKMGYFYLDNTQEMTIERPMMGME
jgi:hypothetical protein